MRENAGAMDRETRLRLEGLGPVELETHLKMSQGQKRWRGLP